MMDVGILVATNILSSLGFGPALGMAAVPDAVIQKYEGSYISFIKGVLGGDLQTLAGGPLFLLLAKYFQDYGPIFNLSFGPKSFLVISDPVMARHILRESPPEQYCKGMLAEILEPIMGKGLIPADPATWKVRRRAIVPGFHKKWLNRMVTLFCERAEILVHDLEKKQNQVVDMEERFCSVTLDIIGKAVFNYDFGSVTKESPIVKAVYRVLREAEHRSSSFIPYWNLPYADKWMGGQVEFRKDMTMLDDILADLINRAVSTRKEASTEELEERDNEEDPSLLRFLVDMRGEDVSSMVLRDDLMTMLIAGHETTAAMLTWTLFELAQGEPGLLREVQAEVRTVMKGKDRPDYDDLVAMKKLRYCLIEALRLYPEPPLLIRRARTEDTLPAGSSGLSDGIKLLRGTDIFISTWNLHRSPDLWEDPETFDPTRFDRPFKNAGVVGWEGYNPDKVQGLYPNEQAADFAFLPFGGGQRRCVGDQFAMMEATVTMVSLRLYVRDTSLLC
jgi:cytochrome P450